MKGAYARGRMGEEEEEIKGYKDDRVYNKE